MKKIIILGGGPSGLSAAWQIGLLKLGKIDIYEKSHKIGGVCGYHDFNGLKLDYGPHKIYSVLPGIMDLFRDLAGDRLKEIKKSHRIIVRGRILNYPIKLKEMLTLFRLPEILALVFSVLAAIIKKPFLKEQVSYEDYCVSVFGRKVYDAVFKSLAEKIWGGDPKTLSADIARTRIPTKNIHDLIFKMLGFKKESGYTNAEIMLYPTHGFYQISECMADEIREKGHTIHLGKRPIKFMRDAYRIKSIVFDDMNEKEVDLVISSIPLRELVGLLFPEDKNMQDKKHFIRMRHSIIIYLFVNRPRVLEDHWIFCSDKDILFSRISEQKLFSDVDFPKDKTVISCDFTSDEDNPVWGQEEDAIAKRCIQELEKLKIVKGTNIIDYRIVKIPHFYPVYGIGYDKKLEVLFEKINQIENIICTGRLGLCSYINMDHCLDMGIFCARELSHGEEPPHINKKLLDRARLYRIVD